MSSQFRTSHLEKLFESYEQGDLPLDLVVNRYFRANKALGSKDRRWIGDQIYHQIRWKGKLEAKEPYEPHEECSFPKEIFDRLVAAYGQERAFELCMISNTEAPVTVRVNTLKTTREELQAKIGGIPCSATGLYFKERIQLMGTPEFKAGHYEVQDEGSQLVAAMVMAKPGDKVLDFCAGSGGKALAIGPCMQNQGQLYLHDVRTRALHEAKKRLARAGVQNAQIKLPPPGTMDWVLVDAPCSGSGTWRRNVDAKWRPQVDYVPLQRQVVEEAMRYLKPKGTLVYATCSLFPEENELQLPFFESLGLVPAGAPFQSFPTEGGMDGFYALPLVLSS